MNKDPLIYFYNNIGFDNSLIKRIVTGAKYVGILLKNGQIGVCSTLGTPIDPRKIPSDVPDLSKRSHRIFYNAYLNALLNYRANPEDEQDIFQHIDFSTHTKIVMIGFFRPLVKKFQEAGIQLDIFDNLENDPVLTPMANIASYLSSAGSVILTSTSIFNGTFEHILKLTGNKTDIFLLGPSSILHQDMTKYRNIKKVYGALFQLNDERILDIIDEGHGTQTFLKFGRKVNI